MTDTAAPASTDAGATAQTDGAVDATTNATEGGDQTGAPNEELFEITVGKNADGKPIVKKMTKEALLKAAGVGVSANERFEEIKQRETQIRQLAMIMKDPERVWDVLNQLGHNVDELLQRRVQKAIEEAQEDPKDREIRVTKAELERYQKQEAAARKAREEAEQKALAESFQTQISDKISSALKAAKLPDTKSNRASAAQILQQLWNHTDETGRQVFPDLLKIPEDKVVQFLKRSRVDGLKSLVDGADDDALLELLPPDLVERVGQALSKKLQGGQGKVDNNVPAPRSKPTDKKQRYLSRDEAEKAIQENLRKAQEAWERRQAKRT